MKFMGKGGGPNASAKKFRTGHSEQCAQADQGRNIFLLVYFAYVRTILPYNSFDCKKNVALIVRKPV